MAVGIINTNGVILLKINESLSVQSVVMKPSILDKPNNLCYNPMMSERLDKEINVLWKEKQEVESPKEDTDDSFVPAKECKMDRETAKIYIEL